MITGAAKRLLEQLKRSDPKTFYGGNDIARIQVDSFVSRVSFIYEKIRNAIDYKEDNLLRKAAIFRILQRRLLLKLSVESPALPLIKELIRAGYLENNFIPQAKFEEVDAIISKYLAIFNLSGSKRSNDAGSQLFKWLLNLCACEVEECLMPPLADQALTEFMFKTMRSAVNLSDQGLSELEKDLGVYLAIYKALVKSDDAMLDFKLLKYFYPGWRNILTDDLLSVAKKINNLKKELDKRRKHPLAQKLYQFYKKYTFVFTVLRVIATDNQEAAEKILNNPTELEAKIIITCDKLYKKARTKLRRSIVRVTIYLFLTKMLLALLMEFPYDYYVAGAVLYVPLAINALFPPFLIFMLGVFIRVPSKKNTARVVNVAKEVLYQDRLSDAKESFKAPAKRSNFAVFTFYLLYFVLFLISFSALIYALELLRFNIFSKLIFLLFLSLVSFFGIKLRLKVREMTVIDKKESALVFLINLFSLPFLKAGHWLSEKFSKINIFVFILDFLIEAPFKIFLEVIEDWIAFLKEKKDEMYSKE